MSPEEERDVTRVSASHVARSAVVCGSTSRSYTYDVPRVGLVRVDLEAGGDAWDAVPVLDYHTDFAVTFHGEEVLYGTLLSSDGHEALARVLRSGAGAWDVEECDGDALVVAKGGALVALRPVRGPEGVVAGMTPGPTATRRDFERAMGTLSFEYLGGAR